MIYEPLTKLQCSPTSDGAAAAILASEDFVDRHGLAERAIEIVGQSLVSDYETSLSTRRARDVIGYDMNVQAARAVYEQSGLGPEDFQVIELHDCFSANELLLYEALGLADEGEGPRLVDDGDTTYGGKWVVEPVGRADLEGPPAGRHRSRPVHRADMAASRRRRRPPGRGRRRRAPAQHRSRRQRRRDRLPARGLTMSTETLKLDESALGAWTEEREFEVTAERIAQYAKATNDPIEAHRARKGRAAGVRDRPRFPVAGGAGPRGRSALAAREDPAWRAGLPLPSCAQPRRQAGRAREDDRLRGVAERHPSGRLPGDPRRRGRARERAVRDLLRPRLR